MTTAATMRQLTIALAVAAATSQAGASAQPPETFTATASVKTTAGPVVSTPVVITITQWTSDADRAKAMAAVKSGDSAAAKAALEALPEAGTLETGQGRRKTSLRFARARSTGSGRVLFLVAPQPLLYLGEGAPGAKPKAGYDFTFVTVLVDGSGNVTSGDLAPAATLKIDANDAIVASDYGAEVVRLTGTAKK